jgi:uncharacterized OB-fold protein
MSMDLSVPETWRVRGPLYRLEAARCEDCGRVHYPPMPACPYCGSRRLVRVKLPSRGILESYTVVYSVPEGARHKAPVVLGLVRLGSVRIVAELTDVAPAELEGVREVEAVLRRVRDDREAGIIRYALKFRPALKPARSSEG